MEVFQRQDLSGWLDQSKRCPPGQRFLLGYTQNSGAWLWGGSCSFLYNAMDFCIGADKILHVKLKNLLFLKAKKSFSAKTVLSGGKLNRIRRI